MGNKPPSAIAEVTTALKNKIKDRMPSIEQAYEDFPAANQELKFPSFSIFTQTPKFQSFDPYIFKVLPKLVSPDPNAGKSPVLYAIGRYEFKFQLDFWCESKFQRHQILEEFVQAFTDLNPTVGVNLKLEKYYDVFIHADFGEIAYDNDSEISSQRDEWRFTVDITTNMVCIKEKLESLMEIIENNLETTEGGSFSED